MRRQRNLLGPQGMGGMVSLWGASSLIKSIQRGSISCTTPSTTVTATISAVDVANSFVMQVGCVATALGGGVDGMLAINTLTNATTVTHTQRSAAASTGVSAFVVVEFMPGVLKSVQAVYMSASPTTITAINTEKAFLAPAGFQGTGTAYPNIDTNFMPYTAITNSTTLTRTAYLGGYAYQQLNVVEFF